MRGYNAIGALAALGAWLGVVACEEEETQTPLPEREVFARAMATLLCEGAKPCCAQRMLPTPGEDCTTRMRDEVYIALLNAEDELQEITLDESQSCLDAYQTALDDMEGCDALPHPRELQDFCPALFGVIPSGDLAPGERCEHVYECAAPEVGERFCYRVDFNEAAICAWLVPVEDGESCAAPVGVYTQCPEGQGCVANELGDDVVCGVPAAPGESCVANNSCEEGLLCRDTADIGEPYCDFMRTIGDSCEDWPEGCEATAFCNGLECEKLPIIAACEDGGCPTPLDVYCDN